MYQKLTAAAPQEIKRPDLYINRELSWIEFNRRVFEEAENGHIPLLERIKFLSIFGTNLDEFFMIRVAGLKDQVAAHVMTLSPDGLTAEQQLMAVRDRSAFAGAAAYLCSGLRATGRETARCHAGILRA